MVWLNAASLAENLPLNLAKAVLISSHACLSRFKVNFSGVPASSDAHTRGPAKVETAAIFAAGWDFLDIKISWLFEIVVSSNIWKGGDDRVRVCSRKGMRVFL